jgi:hypothetical protein
MLKDSFSFFFQNGFVQSLIPFSNKYYAGFHRKRSVNGIDAPRCHGFIYKQFSLSMKYREFLHICHHSKPPVAIISKGYEKLLNDDLSKMGIVYKFQPFKCGYLSKFIHFTCFGSPDKNIQISISVEVFLQFENFHQFL